MLDLNAGVYILCTIFIPSVAASTDRCFRRKYCCCFRKNIVVAFAENITVASAENIVVASAENIVVASAENCQNLQLLPRKIAVAPLCTPVFFLPPILFFYFLLVFPFSTRTNFLGAKFLYERVYHSVCSSLSLIVNYIASMESLSLFTMVGLK